VSVTSPQPWDLSGFVRQIAPAGGGAAPARLRRLVPVLTLVGGGIAAALVVSHGRDFADALGHALSASWGLVVAGGLLEVASVTGYVLLLHRVVSGASPRLRWRDSYDIALAGTAVTRLLPTAGLGGAAVTVWALPVYVPASSPSACSPSSSCYFLGTTCNVLPLPGSLSGGLAGALVALGTPAAPAIAAVLAYRTVAVWLPVASGLPSVARLRATVAAVRCA